ncbi:glycosyltransferase [Paraburkholderia sp. A1RI-2L]|uniref:glycosyltransferase n=1 Tax=Paraburkholderia sp. A1RI-2L TaxID=3028367 RepID=UPI003B791D09
MGQPKYNLLPCTGCGGRQFAPFAIRSDGSQVFQCRICGLGVVGDDSGKAKTAAMGERPEWIERLLALVGGPGRRVYDHAAGNGDVMSRPAAVSYSPSSAGLDAARREVDSGAQIIDELQPITRPPAAVSSQHDIVVSTGVLGHADDFGLAFGQLVDCILPAGVALLSVATLRALKDEQPGPLQRFYPNAACLKRLAAEHGCQLIQAELPEDDYAPIFVGFLTANTDLAQRLQSVLGKLLQPEVDNLSPEERLARLYFNVQHLRRATSGLIRDLERVKPSEISAELLEKAARLWASDLRQLHDSGEQIESLKASRDEQFDRALRWEQSWRKKSEQLEAQTGRLVAKLDVVVRDGKLNVAQANQAVAYEMERSALLEARANGAELRAIQAEQRLLTFYGDYEAMRNSSFWRATAPIRNMLIRYPQAARRARQFARVMWWTAKLKLRANLREVKRRRIAFAEEQAAAARATATIEAPRARLLPVENFAPELESDVRGPVWPAERPLVSVIIPCFNYGHLVREAVASVEAQTFQDVEIIIVEGGSTAVQSRRYFDSLIEGASDRIRVLLQDKAHRAGANRNFGISHARGKYVCCLDADDRLDPTYLEKAVFLLEQYGYDVVSPGMEYFGERSDVFAPTEQPDLASLLKANSILTCSVYPRSLWRAAGGFRDSDPQYGHIHEDWLFWTRLAALGARFLNFREPLLLYRTHGETLSKGSSVIDNEAQASYVSEFNADVLSPEALARSRQRISQDRRVPKPLSNMLRTALVDEQRPTLVLTVPCLILGGAERLLSKIAGRLAEHAWRIIIVSTVPVDTVHGDTTEWFRPFTSEIYHLPRFLPQDRWKDFVDYLFASRHINVLWNAGSIFFYDYLPALTQRFPDLKVADLLFNTVGHTANNRRYSNVIDMHLVENDEVRQWLIDAGEAPERIKRIMSGVDLDAFRPVLDDSALLRELSVPADAVLVGFSGRWSEEKDPLAIVEIARRMPADLPVVFIMLGGGVLESAVRAAAQHAGLTPDRFIIAGPVGDVGSYMSACDILLVPSRVDGRPNAVMEALASGTAVIASRVGGLPEMVEEGVTGYLCAPGDYAAFANRVHELAVNPRLLGEIKRKARSYAEQRLDMNVMLRAYESAFDALLADAHVKPGTPSASDLEG